MSKLKTIKKTINTFLNRMKKEGAKIENALLVTTYEIDEETKIFYMGFELDEDQIQALNNKVNFGINKSQCDLPKEHSRSFADRISKKANKD